MHTISGACLTDSVSVSSRASNITELTARNWGKPISLSSCSEQHLLILCTWEKKSKREREWASKREIHSLLLIPLYYTPATHLHIPYTRVSFLLSHFSSSNLLPYVLSLFFPLLCVFFISAFFGSFCLSVLYRHLRLASAEVVNITTIILFLHQISSSYLKKLMICFLFSPFFDHSRRMLLCCETPHRAQNQFLDNEMV